MPRVLICCARVSSLEITLPSKTAAPVQRSYVSLFCPGHVWPSVQEERPERTDSHHVKLPDQPTDLYCRAVSPPSASCKCLTLPS